MQYDQELCLVCFDKRVGGDKVIGLVTIPMAKLLPGQPFAKWYNIENPKTGNSNLGQVRLRTRFDG